MNQEEGFGPHVTLDLAQCKRETLVNYDFIFNLLDELPGKIGMTKITTPFVRPWVDEWATIPGYSGFVMLAESHISIHTFPESDFVFADIFSCKHFDTEKVIKLLVDAFECKDPDIKTVIRGKKFPKIDN